MSLQSNDSTSLETLAPGLHRAGSGQTGRSVQTAGSGVDSRMTTPLVSSSSSNQSKHPTKLGVATFKDKSVDSTGKHWAVRFGSATASCNSKKYIPLFTVYSVRQTIPAIQHSGYAPTHPFRNSSVRLSILHQEILPKFRPEKTHIRSHG